MTTTTKLAWVPLTYAAHALRRTPPMPMNLTIGVEGFCQSQCKTCFIWRRPYKSIYPTGERSFNLSVDEWRKVFRSIGKRMPIWPTWTGGDQFMRKDFVDLYAAGVEEMNPAICNIPTNSLQSQRVVDYTWEMAHRFPDTRLIINVSMDHTNEAKNDMIRGIKGNQKKSLWVFNELKKMAKTTPNLSVGIHTVWSTFNVDDYKEIVDGFSEMAADQFITEIAEERIEMTNFPNEEYLKDPKRQEVVKKALAEFIFQPETAKAIGLGHITPTREQYRLAIEYLIHKMETRQWPGFSNVTRAFRLQYYKNVLKYLGNHQQAIPCFAGFASAQINYEGTVWPCCVEAVPLGNLRDNNYDFKTIWRGHLAKQARERITSQQCACPLANASYTNMLHHPSSMVSIVRELLT